MISTKTLTGFTPAEIHKMALILNRLRPEPDGYIHFDFPDYGNLPKGLSSRFESEQVDLIQDEIQYVDREFDALLLASLLARGKSFQALHNY
jgi:hypothetical protein